MKGCIKKPNLVGLLAFMFFCFTGCGNNLDTDQSSQGEQSSESAQDESNDTVSSDDSLKESSQDIQSQENTQEVLSDEIAANESGEEIMEKVKQKMKDRDKWKVEQVVTMPLGDGESVLTNKSSFNYIKENDNDESFSIKIEENKDIISLIKEHDYLYCTKLSSDEEDCLKYKAKDDGSALKKALEVMEEIYYNNDIKNWQVKVEGGNYVISGSCSQEEGSLNMTCTVDSDYNILSSEEKIGCKFSDDAKEMVIEKKHTFSYDDVNIPKVENPSDYEIYNEDILDNLE